MMASAGKGGRGGKGCICQQIASSGPFGGVCRTATLLSAVDCNLSVHGEEFATRDHLPTRLGWRYRGTSHSRAGVFYGCGVSCGCGWEHHLAITHRAHSCMALGAGSHHPRPLCPAVSCKGIANRHPRPPAHPIVNTHPRPLFTPRRVICFNKS